ncbi:MAG: metalloregulator ArsR/SmtB family transcription factor [Candidatus Omnitrophota bacterium]|nr:metalloregulator ArsR/SmtB family transcription factor [Candidatus Omnitrophota bacterium]
MGNKLYELHAQMCKVFTSPKRLEILNLLRNNELSVNQVAKKANIRQANISQHLSILREKGIVKTRRAGKTIYYSLVSPKIIKAFDIIREMLLERLAENDKLIKGIRK